jgi:hypothetical protein
MTSETYDEKRNELASQSLFSGNFLSSTCLLAFGLVLVQIVL